MIRLWLGIGAGVMLTAVVLGAFGAHALKEKLEAAGTAEAWRTAVLYQMVHGLGLLIVCVFLSTYGPLGDNASLLKWTGILFVAGTVLFSGSIYFLAVGGPKWLGPVTPLGGLLMIAGWGTLLAAAFWKE